MAKSIVAHTNPDGSTEFTPRPWSAMEEWVINKIDQENLSAFMLSMTGPNFLAYLREFSMNIAGRPGVSGDYVAGVQEGARSVVEEILNMTKERYGFLQARVLERRNAQIGMGLPEARRLRQPDPIPRTRLTGPLPPKDETPPESPPPT